MWMGFVPPLYPYFARVYRDNLKAKLIGLEFVNRTVFDKNEYDLW